MHFRMWHQLRPNARVETPQRFVVLDTETRPTLLEDGTTRHDLRLGVADYVELPRSRHAGRMETLEFTESWPFIVWLNDLTRSKTRLWLVAHNLSFDAQVVALIPNLLAAGWRLTTAIIDSPPTILDFRKGTRTIHCVDTVNYLPYSLDYLGQVWGVGKLPMPPFDAPDAAWWEYCRQDVRVLREVVDRLIAFVRDNDLGNFANTAAGQAFNAFRHRFMRHPVYIHNHRAALLVERSGYFGGRTECYFVGRVDARVHLLDVNSMYPFVMRDHRYPVKLIRTLYRPPSGVVRETVAHHLCMMRCTLETDTPLYPYRERGRLTFPVGRFTTTLSTPEIIQALKRGHLCSVERMTFYAGAPLFESYVTALYQMRLVFEEEGNRPMALLCKMLLNSLYGKFGQRGVVWEVTDLDPTDKPSYWQEVDALTRRVEEYRRIGDCVQIRQRTEESYHSFPAVAAHVTAYARIHLYGLIQQGGRENVYYCDTDSLFVNDAGLENLRSHIDPHRLGALKIAGVTEGLTLRGLKDYVTDREEKIKGVSRKATQLDPDTYRQEHFRSLLAAVRAGETDRQLTYPVVKHLSRVYEKGTVTPSGWVTPRRLTE